MTRIRLLSPCTVCLLALAVTPAEPSAAQSRTNQRSPGRDRILATIGRPADGTMTFRQQGGDLLLQLDDTALTRITLPHQMTVHTAARHRDQVWIAGRAASADIHRMVVVSVATDGSLTPLPSPPGRKQTRTFPSLLVDGDRVAGVVWQEGNRQEDNSIRAAAWNGDDWAPVEIVSPPRGKEQTGLAGTVLADGSWLAVWAAVDGEPGERGDDDLWWSRRVHGSWSQPQRLHEDNQVPDILPRLAPTRDGALVVWTWYDGNDYRLRLALLDRDSWTERPIASGRGADPAGFVQLESGLAILSSSVVPEVWSLIEVDEAGRARSHTRAPRLRADPPLVLEGRATRRLHWPAGADRVAPLELELSPGPGP